MMLMVCWCMYDDDGSMPSSPPPSFAPQLLLLVTSDPSLTPCTFLGIEAETGTIPDAPHPMSLIKLYASFQCDRCVMDVLRIAEGPEGFVEQFDHRR